MGDAFCMSDMIGRDGPERLGRGAKLRAGRCSIWRVDAWTAVTAGMVGASNQRRDRMVALIVLLLLLAVLGGLGFAAHVLWYILIAAVILWLIGFFLGGAADGGRRGWYRW